MQNNKRLLVERIRQNIPSHIKPINYLMDKLDIGREAAYRRIKGDISFTFDELSMLAYELNFSIDEIVYGNSQSHLIVDNILSENKNPEADFMVLLQKYCTVYMQMPKKEDIEIISSQNKIPLSLILLNEDLFKFYFYKYLHQTCHIPFHQTYSETIFSDKLHSLREKFINQYSGFKQFTVIVNIDYFMSFCQEIRYYYFRKLISDEVVSQLKHTLSHLLETIKHTISKGYDSNGNKYNYFISFLGIDANTDYVTYNNNFISFFWIYSPCFINVHNGEFCHKHKLWLESLKKYSTLISQSSEFLQAEFFERQQEYINQITTPFSHFNNMFENLSL